MQPINRYGFQKGICPPLERQGPCDEGKDFFSTGAHPPSTDLQLTRLPLTCKERWINWHVHSTQLIKGTVGIVIGMKIVIGMNIEIGIAMKISHPSACVQVFHILTRGFGISRSLAHDIFQRTSACNEVSKPTYHS